MQLAVFVNSSDGFEDCWAPFFKLFSAYGGGLRGLPVYLNTERKQFECGEMEVLATCVWPRSEIVRPTWSECLYRGLDAVREDLVLYLQEDYFLTQAVRSEIVEEALELLRCDERIGVIYLSDNGPRVAKSCRHAGSFLEVSLPAHYLINTQAAIWRKSYLRSVARPWENAWMFEKFGTLREGATRRRILMVTPEALAQGEVIHYVWSGVMKGKWKPECVDLFRKHDISADFAKRGFYREGSLWKYRIEVLYKLFGRPVPAIRSIHSLLGGCQRG